MQPAMQRAACYCSGPVMLLASSTPSLAQTQERVLRLEAALCPTLSRHPKLLSPSTLSALRRGYVYRFPFLVRAAWL